MAAPPFGFSAGDFIAGVSLVRKSIRALNDSAGARASYRQLVSELSELDEALTGVSNLQLSPTQSAQKVALEQVVSQCQNSITAFLNQNSKFQRSLATASGQPSSTTRWKASIHKIQWALCKDGAIQTLRTEIQAHTRTLNLLLSTIQMYAFAVDVSSLMLSVQADQISSASAESQGTALGTCTNLVQRTHSQTGETLALVKQNQRILASQADQIASISSTVARFMTSRQADRVEANDPRLLVTDVMEANVMTELDAVNCNIEQNPQDKSGVSQQDKSLMYDFRRAEVLHLPMEATSPRLDDPDTLTVGALDLTLFWPRLYFLRVCQTRVDQVFGEWRAVVDRIELSLDQHRPDHISDSSRSLNRQYSQREKQILPHQRNSYFINSTSVLLTRQSGVISAVLAAWDKFEERHSKSFPEEKHSPLMASISYVLSKMKVLAFRLDNLNNEITKWDAVVGLPSQ